MKKKIFTEFKFYFSLLFVTPLHQLHSLSDHHYYQVTGENTKHRYYATKRVFKDTRVAREGHV